MHNAILETNLPGLNKIYAGKVREVYDIGDYFMLVATDRISAFDVVFNEGIPDKGRILTQLSNYWFRAIGMENHLVYTDVADFPDSCKPYADILNERAVMVKKANRIDFECIVRGYIIGSGWKDYQKTGAISGITLPKNLRLADKLPEPIFTPSTKAPDGEHDMNVDFAYMENEIGKETAQRLRDRSIEIYSKANGMMETNGIILADTKLEFGFDKNGTLMCIDECLTPDSSRFWDGARYTPGTNPESFDKQIFRDYLESTGWNKMPPPPAIPESIIEETRARYAEIYTRIVGKERERA